MKKVLVWMIVLLVAASSFGCAKPKPMTREESLALRRQQIADTTHVYHNTDVNSVLVAANSVFQLADEDYEMEHHESGLIAKRSYSMYLVLAAVFGQDSWYLEAEQDGDDVALRARLVSNASSMAGMATGAGGASVTTFPPIEVSVKESGPYKMLFSRIGFLLKQSPIWYTCAESKELKPGHKLGEFTAFCVCANDDLPEGVTPKNPPSKADATNGIYMLAD